MTLIYPGGGNCDPNEEPCVGPDCVNPPVGDPDNPIVDDGCLINCGGPTTCTGPDCVNGQCVGPDCSYGEDGDWHAYWVCNPDAVGSSVVVAGEVNVQEPQNGGLNNLEGQNLHFKLSNAGFEALGLPLIQIGDSFQYIDPNDVVSIDEDGEPIVTQYPCFTYLGKKHGVTWNQASPPGMSQHMSAWATGPTNLGPSLGSPVSNSFTPYTNYSTNGEPCPCQATPDPPSPETGCQDPAACNYSDTATIHNQELCCYITGCDDEIALNYNINACCNDGSCCYIGGCTDSAAINYNIQACYDDSSCCYTRGCTDSTASNYDASACEDDGSCIYGDLYTYGIWCSTVSGIRNGQVVVVTETYYNLYDTSSDNWGCTDTALVALESTGALEIVVPGMNVVSNENVGEELIETCTLFLGTMTGNDVAGPSFDLPLSATVSIPFKAQGMCPLGLGFTASNSLSKIVSTSFQEPSCGSCCDKITDPNCDSGGNDEVGCTDPDAYNYNGNATTTDNSTCEWRIPRWSIASDTSFSSMPNQMVPDVNPQGASAVDHYIFHLDDMLGYKVFVTGGTSASNVLDYFHSEGTALTGGATGATLKDAQYFGLTYRDVVVSGAIPQALDVVQYEYSNASTENTAKTDCMRYLGDDIYTGDGNVSFGSLMGPTRVIFGPMRTTAYTYPNVTSTSIVESCTGTSTQPSGCTDATATNFDPYAVIDDGTCSYTISDVSGCTDASATNYNALATVDDGSCLPAVSCITVDSSVVLTGLNSSVSAVNATAAGECMDGELSLTVTGISSAYSDLGMTHPTFYTFEFYKKDSPYTGSSLTEGTQVSGQVVNVSSFPITLTETGITAGPINGNVQYYRWVARNIDCEYASGAYSFGSCVGS
jgi:hypothetical protein